MYPRRFKHSFKDWSLMGGFVRPNESMENAALRVLDYTVGLKNIYLEQVQGFSAPDRDPGGRVISMTYYALIRIDEHDKELTRSHGGQWFPVSKLPKLIFDHKDMVNVALEKLRFKATYQLLGKELLPELFTLTQLNNLYNAIFQRTFDQANFRKKLASIDILERTAIKETGTSKRGSFLYKFSDNPDHKNYDRIVKF